MDLLHILPFISTAITFVFAVAVLNRYRVGRRQHSLFWGLGLVLYGLGTFAEAYLALGWSALLLRLWYLSGAMLTAAWLGQGTVYLLVRRRGMVHALTALLAVASLVAAVAVFTAPLEAGAFRLGVPISTQYRDLLTRGGLMVSLTILLNIYGTLTLVGGALWSAWLFWRKRVLLNRVAGNVLIAAGAMFPASAGLFIRLGWADWLYASELVGAALMFLGFYLATQPQPRAAAAPNRV
ncbi:MAG: hypothetical protein IT318_07590 [Anaerolineales bacterium]|nr:hypothetical protein [Anaerolineales bacterium]